MLDIASMYDLDRTGRFRETETYVQYTGSTTQKQRERDNVLTHALREQLSLE